MRQVDGAFSFLDRNPTSYPELEDKFGPDVKTVLGRACAQGQMFYFYDVLALVKDRVWGTITWVGADDYDITSPTRVLRLLDEIPQDRHDRLRRKLREISANVTEYGEWKYRVFARTPDVETALQCFGGQFSIDGVVRVYPSGKGDIGGWISRPPLALSWEQASESEQKDLQAAVADLERYFARARMKSQFVSFFFWSRCRIGLRHFYPPSNPEILSLQCSNAARASMEAGAVATAAKDDDFRLALRPWLPPNG